MKPFALIVGNTLTAFRLLGLVLAAAAAASAAQLAFVTTSLPNAKYGNTYNFRVQATGGVAPYDFYIDPHALPLGLYFNTTGLFAEAPLSAPGIYPVTIRLRDSSSPQQVVNRQFTITVVPGIKVNGLAYLPPGAVGATYSYDFSAEGGTPPYRFAIPSGGQPPGLLMGTTTGELSGTPTVRGSYSFQVTAVDAAGIDGAADFRLDISGLPFTITPATLPDGRVGVTYSPVTFSAAGGAPPYSYSFVSGSVPGLSLTAQGVLSGSPTTRGGFPFDLTVTDSIGNWWVFTLSVNVRAPLTLEPDTLPDGTLGTAYEALIQANGFRDDVAISVISGAFPNGLTLSRLGGQVFILQGMPSRAGTYSFTVKVQDSSGASLSRAYTIRIVDPQQLPLELGPLSVSRGWVGESLNGYIGAIAGRYPITITVASGSLPPGITMSSGGLFAGTPTTAGVYVFRLEARDSDNRTGSREYTISVYANHLTVMPNTIPEADAGTPYSVAFTASGGVPPYTFAPTIAGTPELMTLSSAGILSGTPPRATTTTFDVSATDSQGNYQVRSYTLVIRGLTITTETLPPAVWGVPYSAQLAAADGVPPYRFETACILPGGLTLSSSGLISGTPLGPGGPSCYIWVRDSAGNSNARRFVISYSDPGLTLSPVTLPAATVNILYITQIQASGAGGTVSYEIVSGSLPPGLATSVPSPGYLRISGVPRVAGSYPFRLKATAGSNTVSWDYSIAVSNQPVLIGPDVLPGAVRYTTYSADLTATLGTAPYSFQVLDGQLPLGITLSTTGALLGTPELAGTFGFIARATDSHGLVGTKPFQIVVADATLVLTPAELPNGAIGQGYAAAIRASGGTAPYSYYISDGALPAGLSLSTGGNLSGSPSRAGTFTFRVNARDSRGLVGARNYQMEVTGATLTLGPTALPDARPGEAYSARLTAAGGTPPYSFHMTHANPWVGGLQVNSDGTITGSPTGNGPLTLVLTVTATDANGSVGSRQYQIRLLSTSLMITPVTLPPATVGQAYDVSFTAVGGTSPYSFRVSSGRIPAEFTFGAQGRIFGTPAQAGAYSFVVEVADSADATAGRSYALSVSASGLHVGPEVLPFATAGAPYSALFTAAGGTAPYRFALSSGNIPMGLSLASNGRLSGNLQVAGLCTFRIGATDAVGLQGQRDYELRVSAIEVSPGWLGAATVGRSYAAALSATGGSAPYVFSIASGALPPGLNLQGGTNIAGTPTSPGTFYFTLRARDSAGAEGIRDFTLVVNPGGILLTPESLPEGAIGEEYFAVLAAKGGAAPYSFTIRTGALPAGLGLETSGMLSGVPEESGTSTFTVEARDGEGNTGSRQYTLSVESGPALTVVTTWLARATAQVAYGAELNASGGRPPYRWEVSSGSLPSGVQLSTGGSISGTPAESGQFVFSARVGDAAGRSSERALALMVTAGSSSANTLFFDPPALSFSARAGASAAGATRCVAVFSTRLSADFAASLYTPPTAWATLDSAAARTPAAVCVTFKPEGLPAGSYRGELRLTSSQALPATASIPLVLTMEPASPPVLQVSPQRLQVLALRGASPSVHSVWAINGGSGSLPFTVEAPDVPWLTVDPGAGMASAGEPSAVSVRVDSAGLTAGVYAANVLVRSGLRVEPVRVELVVSEGGVRISLSQSAVELLAWTGGAAVSSTVGLTNYGLRPLSAAAVLPIAASPGWLQVEPAQATFEAGETALLKISANPSTLSPGRYSGRIEVRAADAMDSPQNVTVGLTVLTADAPLPPDAAMPPVVLTRDSPRQTVTLAAPPTPSLKFTSIAVGPDSGWLRITPAAGDVAAGGAVDLTIAADAAGLGPGDHQAMAAIGFSDGTALRVPVSLTLAPAVTGAANQAEKSAHGCDPNRPVVLHLLSPSPGFQATARKPVAIASRIQLCDGTVPASVRATVLIGGQSLALAPESKGVWTGTWVPDKPQEQVRVEVVAETGGGEAMASADGTVTAASGKEPSLTAGIHSATLRATDPLAPGAWITLFGSDFADAPVVATPPIVPDTLAGLQVLIGGLPLRLYYVGTSQVNALLPGALPANTIQQLMLMRDGVPAVPLNTVIAEVQPGVFTMNQQGTGQAAALHAGTGILADQSTPARRGETIEIYGAGLGPVDVAVPDGEAAPLASLARVRIPVLATVGGRHAEVSFAGLTPGTFGLYQVNVRIPDDAPTGGAVEVQLTQGSAVSNTVTIAISN